MKDGELDSIDERILFELQREGRATITELAETVPVSGNTVRNRILAMEEADIIRGYTIEVDYVGAGFPFHYQFTCTVPIADRRRLVEEAFEVDGVLDVRELMTGQQNVVIEVVGATQDDITEIAQTLDDLGLDVVDETLIKSAETRPLTLWANDDDPDESEREDPSS
ncbi:AsnC family transcriptional regulator [Salinirubellus sp. GCM10025818]|uniref:Lrp/AsnC family transcriptional regulator n=1 Tax=Salinirubellus TaxID=2162630 RepID=UPI0030CAD59A